MAVLATLGRHTVFRGYKQLHACLLGCIGDGPLCGKRTVCECGDDDLHVVLPKDGCERLDVCVVHGGDLGTLEKGALSRGALGACERNDRGSAVDQRLARTLGQHCGTKRDVTYLHNATADGGTSTCDCERGVGHRG